MTKKELEFIIKFLKKNTEDLISILENKYADAEEKRKPTKKRGVELLQ